MHSLWGHSHITFPPDGHVILGPGYFHVVILEEFAECSVMIAVVSDALFDPRALKSFFSARLATIALHLATATTK